MRSYTMKNSTIKLFGWILVITGVYVFITLIHWYNYLDNSFFDNLWEGAKKSSLVILLCGSFFLGFGIILCRFSGDLFDNFERKVVLVLGFLSLCFGLVFINIWHLYLTYDTTMAYVYNLPPVCYIITIIILTVPGILLLTRKDKKI